MRIRRLRRTTVDHEGAAVEARAHRGTWVLAALYSARYTARKAALLVPGDEAYPCYAPGEFEAYAAFSIDGWSVWVRWVGGGDPLPALPDTMTVRVASRGDWVEDGELGVITVTVAARCARCGGPRGWDTVRPDRIQERGEWFTVDRWRNPCAHQDKYGDVLQESRLRPLPRPAGTAAPRVRYVANVPEPGSPAGLVLAATEGRPTMHAAQAAELLETEHGLTAEARLIRAEIATRSGHMSAKAAAHFLHTTGKDAR
ncbi:hypothetical protein [Streptomyces cyaneofuscatus]|uniref:hypothetical protein n=1 Tax=Streptomyces cyaneofuscatus TaxID=66883 RepID=UPI0036DC5EEB